MGPDRVAQDHEPHADTIVAVASAPGRSARAIIRLSGPGTLEVLRAVLAPGDDVARGVGRVAVGAWSCPVLVWSRRGPSTYTGEDVAELQLPGNPELVGRVVRGIAQIEGVRHANPGEFTARGYLRGRLSLDQAEGVAAAIAAATDAELASSRELLSGVQGKRYRAWADEVAGLLALVEAGIDFTDQEDVVAIAPAKLASRAGALAADIGGKLGAAVPGGERLEPLVVLAGRPNAGKSTLFNALLGVRRAVESARAGTTRDALVEPLDLGWWGSSLGTGVLLGDLPGLDASPGAGPSALAAQAAAREVLARADVVLWCDRSGVFAPGELPEVPGRVVRVRTCADVPGQRGAEDVAVCALDGWNLGPLRGAIAQAASSSRAAGVIALLPRHRRELSRAAEALRAAREGAGAPELAAASLRDALDALGRLCGRVSADDVLGLVFASFCVGK